MPFILPHDQWTTKNGLFIDDIGDPLRTVTARSSNGARVVSPSVDHDRAVMDIYFRMLKPRELARAQGFPDDYHFIGNKGQVVKQIGNAVPVSTATALCESILRKAA
jgi:DNA (cytosine-5)-methyltransferase 1